MFVLGIGLGAEVLNAWRKVDTSVILPTLPVPLNTVSTAWMMGRGSCGEESSENRKPGTSGQFLLCNAMPVGSGRLSVGLHACMHDWLAMIMVMVMSGIQA